MRISIYIIILYFINIVFIKKNVNYKLRDINTTNLLEIIFILIICIFVFNNKLNIVLGMFLIFLIVCISYFIDLIYMRDKDNYFIVINKGRISLTDLIKSRIKISYFLNELINCNLKEIDTGIAIGNKIYFYKNELVLLINNQKIISKNLEKINKDEVWLLNVLDDDISNIKLGIYKNNKVYLIKKEI